MSKNYSGARTKHMSVNTLPIPTFLGQRDMLLGSRIKQFLPVLLAHAKIVHALDPCIGLR